MTKADELWVFGYGSLVWNPGIAVAETKRATLADFRRSFCMWSIHHRGSETEPGLVLALDAHAGGSCSGVAIRAADHDAALTELRARELISSAYYEQQVTLLAEDGASIAALAYVIDTGHEQYCPDLTLEQQAQIIARAQGGRGPNHEYLTRTAAGLDHLEIPDPAMTWLVTRVQQIIDAS